MKSSIVRFTVACLTALALAVGKAASAASYDTGQGYAYPTLASVPWSSLQPGDSVNIHWQAQPYREHILLSQSGTPAQHIVVRGIPDPQTGQLPVLDSAQAVEAPNIGYCWGGLAGNGAIMVSPRAGFVYGYIPSYIDIESLKVVNARAPLTFTAPNGTVQNYARFTAAINIERGQHIAIRNCELTASGLGLFVNSKYGTDALSADILVEYNNIHHNGVLNDASCHNCYTECAGVTYQYNHIGPVIAGSYADAIKDRSSGLVIRYNNIESGPADCLDLIEAQSDPLIATLPDYNKTWVYGNTFYNGPTGASYLINYGGMDIHYEMYRQETLYFYNNTVVNQQAYNAWWRTCVFVFPYKSYIGQASMERVDCRNNLFYSMPLTPGAQTANLALVATDNTPYLDLGSNFLSPGTQLMYYTGQGAVGGSVTGWAQQMFGDGNGFNNPGFVDPFNLDFRLANTSVCIDKGMAQHPAVAGQYDPLFELLPNGSVMPRSLLGTAIDLGAFEDSGLVAVNPPPKVVGPPIITSFTPGNGPVGSVVTLTGQNFTGATIVALHDVPCAYTVINDTTITLTVPQMASGPAKVKVVTPAGKGWAVAYFVVN